MVDYGAGTGIYTIAVAEAVPEGKVFAVEALPQLVEPLRDKITRELRAGWHLRDRRQRGPRRRRRGRPGGHGRVLHHLYDQPEALEEVVRVLKPGGLFVVVDWGDTERPLGPPRGHVLGLQAIRDIIAGMGLEIVEAHEPGELLKYHVMAVARSSS